MGGPLGRARDKKNAKELEAELLCVDALLPRRVIRDQLFIDRKIQEIEETVGACEWNDIQQEDIDAAEERYLSML